MNFGDIGGTIRANRKPSGPAAVGADCPCLFIHGEAGAGKRTLASICARALVCEGDAKHRPCDECGPCRRALSGNHPDIQTVEPGYASGVRGDKRPKSISVDDVRALSEFLSRRPFEAERNVALIPHAQLMTPQAQNALLKTLETPPGAERAYTHMRQPAGIVAHYNLALPGRAHAAAGRGTGARIPFGTGVPSERAHLLAAISGGSIGRALDMDAMRTTGMCAPPCWMRWRNWRTGRGWPLSPARLRDMRDSADWVLDTFELYARDLMLDGEAAPLNIDRRAQIAVQSRRLNGLNMLGGVMRARERLRSNVGWASVLDMICFDALEV